MPALHSKNYDVLKLLRSKQSVRKRHPSWDVQTGAIETDKLEDVKGVIHLAGAGIADSKWTPKRKQLIYESRINGTQQVVQAMKQMRRPPKFFICANAVGFYGDRGEEVLTEDSAPGEGFLAEISRDWENEALKARELGIRTCLARLGMVITKDGGALDKMLRPLKTGLGGPLGSGKQYMSWIDINDLVRAVLFLIEREDLSGPFNFTSPDPKTNKDFTRALGKVIKRPTIIPAPAFALRGVLGEMADGLLLSSTRAVPKRLIDAGFNFNYPSLEECLAHQLQRK